MKKHEPELIKLEGKSTADNNAELKIIDELSEKFFTPKRIYFINGYGERGKHYHENCDQIIAPIFNPQTIHLKKDGQFLTYNLTPLIDAIFIPRGWSLTLNMPPKSITLALASESYKNTETFKEL